MISKIAIALLLLTSSAYAECLTHKQARVIWPDDYLHWKGNHCWSGPKIEEEVPLPKERPVTDWIYSDRWWMS